jgi:hypothetical protein
MDWRDCINQKIAKKITPDAELIKSLINTSNNKLESETKLAMEDVTADSKVSLAYDSLRELLEALSIKTSYKIYNHEGYTPFLKEILQQDSIAEEFDDIRKIRNSINYYGKSVSKEEAAEIIQRIISLRKLIGELL